ncbi:MAG: adenosylcobalamin-dependent ribonucleoside-diphosphate reductase [Bacteroidales bacterium]|nr:adenosylcobalamin-dependent ribonucleoside-diphosphate reductase [Bacteroidales bacterium]
MINEIKPIEVHKQFKKYSFEEAFNESLKYFKGDALAARVFVNKYALKDSFGNIYENSPEQMHNRIANEIHRIEKKYPNPLSKEKIYSLLEGFKYIIPQGSPMSGIGNNFQLVSLSNCFVIGFDKGGADSYGGIMKMDQEQVQLMKRRGGVGHDLSHIRPKGSPVFNSALTSTGIVPFMERFSNSTREVAQDGRRGALMLTLNVKHPDAEDFIDAKLEQGKITGANISIKIDDEFMRAVDQNTEYKQQFPLNSNDPIYEKSIEARNLWSKIIHNAWKSAEPGILFWDTVTRESVADSYADLGFKTVATNPCGEIPLCPYDSCRLLAINLYGYVENPFTPQAKFNFEKFKQHVHYAQRMMDDIIDLELEKIDKIIAKIDEDPEEKEVKLVERRLWEKIKEKANQGRRTGIGITAEGDMLAALGLTYGSEDATDFSVEVHKTVAIEAYRGSVNLAKDRGAFPIYDAKREKENPFINRIKKEDNELYNEMEKYGRRNISLLTIAPTGSTSILSQTTSGIEPVFMPYYKRRRKVNPNDPDVTVSFVDELGDTWEEYAVFHHKFITWLEVNDYNVEEVKNYDDEKLKKVFEKSPYYKATSQDVNWVNKVLMQGRIQKWIDHSISVTINLPEDSEEGLVDELYLTAWKSGCKGITIYREGSRDGVLISNKKEKEKPEKENETISDDSESEDEDLRRPKVVDTDIIRFYNNNQKWIAFIGLKNGNPYEIFTGIDEPEYLPIPQTVSRGYIIKVKNEGGDKRYDFQYVNKAGFHVTIEGLSYKFNKEYWNYAKLISGVLRHGMPIEKVVTLVSSLHLESDTMNTWKKGVERALKRYIPNGTKVKKGVECPQCESHELVYQEGCLTCLSCGYSKCG